MYRVVTPLLRPLYCFTSFSSYFLSPPYPFTFSPPFLGVPLSFLSACSHFSPHSVLYFSLFNCLFPPPPQTFPTPSCCYTLFALISCPPRSFHSIPPPPPHHSVDREIFGRGHLDGKLIWSIWTRKRIHVTVCWCVWVCMFLQSLACREGGSNFLHMYRFTSSGATRVGQESWLRSVITKFKLYVKSVTVASFYPVSVLPLVISGF
jgi:hypothetical protein